MKYRIELNVRLSPVETHYTSGSIDLRETAEAEINTLSSAAALLVKIHELFEVAKKEVK